MLLPASESFRYKHIVDLYEKNSLSTNALLKSMIRTYEGFNGWGGRGYDDFVPEEVTKTAPSGDETT